MTFYFSNLKENFVCVKIIKYCNLDEIVPHEKIPHLSYISLKTKFVQNFKYII